MTVSLSCTIHFKDHYNCSTHKVFSVFISRCLVATSNGGLCPFSGFSKCPQPQLPASHFAQLQLRFKAKVRVTLWLAVYRQSVRLGDKLLETHDHRFFFQLNHCCYSSYETSSLTRRRVCILWYAWTFIRCTYRTYGMLLNISCFCTI
jgi:hypothetical protein